MKSEKSCHDGVDKLVDQYGLPKVLDELADLNHQRSHTEAGDRTTRLIEDAAESAKESERNAQSPPSTK